MPLLIALSALSADPALAGTCLVDLDLGEIDCSAFDPSEAAQPRLEETAGGLKLQLDPRRPLTLEIDDEPIPSAEGCEGVEETVQIFAGEVPLADVTRPMSSCSGRYRLAMEEDLLFYSSDDLSVVVPIEEFTTTLTLRRTVSEDARPVFVAIDQL